MVVVAFLECGQSAGRILLNYNCIWAEIREDITLKLLVTNNMQCYETA